MGLKLRKILGVKISAENIENVLEETRKYLKLNSKIQETRDKKALKPLVIFTPNPEIINYAQKDKIFKKIVNSAQINIADGAGVAWALRKIYKIRISAIPGVELMEKLCQEVAINGNRIGLIGGRDGLAVETAERLRKSYPKLRIEVLGEPEIKITNYKLQITNNPTSSRGAGLRGARKKTEKYFENLVIEIVRKNIDILFVALGFPKQEYFISRLSNSLSGQNQLSRLSRLGNLSHTEQNRRPMVMMGVGGSFDFIAGRIKRAPVWMRERGLEWLYRLVREPVRIKRQIAGSEFFLKVVFTKQESR